MTFHTQVVGANGQRQAMFIERVEGLAEDDPRELRPAPARRDDRLQRGRPDGRADRDGDGARASAGCRSSPSPRSTQSRAATPRTRRARACSTTPTSCSTSARRPATRSSQSTASTRPVGAGLDARGGGARQRGQGAHGGAARRSGARCRRSSRARRSWAPRALGRLFDAAYAEHARRAGARASPRVTPIREPSEKCTRRGVGYDRAQELRLQRRRKRG